MPTPGYKITRVRVERALNTVKDPHAIELIVI